MSDLVAFNFHALKVAENQCADEEVAFPLRKFLPCIKCRAAGRYGGRPLPDRVFHAWQGGMFRDSRADHVVAAESCDGPAEIGAGFQDIDFIAALGAVFDFPYFSCFGVHGHALRVTVAVAVYFRENIRVIYEGIVFGDCAVRLYPHDCSQMVLRVLRLLLIAAFAGRDEKRSVLRKDEAASEMDIALDLGFLLEDALHLIQPGLIYVKLGAERFRPGDIRVLQVGDRGGEINPVAVLKVRRDEDIEKTALSFGVNDGYVLDFGLLAVLGDMPEFSAPFGDHVTALAGQKGQAPGVVEFGRDGVQLERGFLGFESANCRFTASKRPHSSQKQCYRRCKDQAFHENRYSKQEL